MSPGGNQNDKNDDGCQKKRSDLRTEKMVFNRKALGLFAHLQKKSGPRRQCKKNNGPEQEAECFPAAAGICSGIDFFHARILRKIGPNVNSFQQANVLPY
jgi:hypothetical protein